MRPGSRAARLLHAVAVLSASSLLCAASGTAFADSEAQGTLSASAGWTDNYDAASSTKSDSAFLSLEPGGQLLVASPSTVQRIAYRLGINVFLVGGGATSFSNNLSYDVNHTLSEFTDALFSAAVNHITTNTASPVSADVGGGINAVPVGSNQFIGFAGGLGLSHQISDLWRTTQGVNAVYTTPVDSTGFVRGATFNGTAALGLDRDLQNANIGLNLGATYTFIEGLGAGATGAGPVDDQKQVVFTGIARYTRPLSTEWTLDLSGGVAAAAPADSIGDLQFYPTGGGVLGWQSEKHSAGLSYNHGVNTNPFLRSTIIADDVVARGGIPLFGSPRWSLVGSVGYQHARTLVFETGAATSSLDLFSVDAALDYEISATMNVGARYQLNYQNGDSAVVPDLVRNAVSVVFSAKYPDKTKTVMPFRQPLKMLRDPTLGEPEDHPRGGRGGF
jgi:hypothetical protein